MKHTPPPLAVNLLAMAVLSIRKTEKISDGVTAVSGSEVVGHVSSQVKSSHLYLYSAFNNTNCNKALHNIKIGKLCQ